jgi:SCP-2 sterol transfer family
VGRVATIEQCMTALQAVLGEIASHKATAGLDRSVSCRFPDLGQAILGRLNDGAFSDVHAVDDGPGLPRADVRLTMDSDDLIAMTDGRLSFPKAMLSGKVKIEAPLKDMFRLRSAF